jgi:hypothetical protein
MSQKSMVMLTKALMVLVVLAALFLGASAEPVTVNPKASSSAAALTERQANLKTNFEKLIAEAVALKSKLVS